MALNALTYRVLNGEYPPTLYDLYNSSSWNIDLNNMFTGQPVDAIMFAPGPEDMTSTVEVGLPFDFQYTPPLTPAPAPGGDGGGDGEGGGESLSPIEMSMITDTVYFRVDPTRVRNTSPGDIFYYVDSDLLQLLMYSGDGVYAEHFEAAPNGRWEAKIRLREGGRDWQQDVLAAQVLFFAGEMLPQYYNHVRYMAEQPLLSYTEPQRIDPATVLELAAALDITLLNPSTKQPIGVAQTFSRGDFIEPPAGGPAVLAIGLQGGHASTLAQLYETYAEPDQMQARPERKPAAPPLGGSPLTGPGFPLKYKPLDADSPTSHCRENPMSASETSGGAGSKTLQVLEALKQVVDPARGDNVVALGRVKNLSIKENEVSFDLLMPPDNAIDEDALDEQLDGIFRAIPWVSGVQFGLVRGEATPAPPPQAPPQKKHEPTISEQSMPEIKHVIAVGSGKGGVGKSTVSVNLALALAKQGHRVGLMDADVYGPSVPLMLGLEGNPMVNTEQKLEPLEKHGMKVMSMGFLLKPDQAVVWRGPMIHGVIRQFLSDVEWGELDYLIVDLPPGTGDAPLS
ncbi:MAG TPA: MRP family ATP-binding protein, partial [Firmicutes bacterium]|nr:MRP family ATP-binding protein [Bacillota bacterium]